jgi:hypothetical protein
MSALRPYAKLGQTLAFGYDVVSFNASCADAHRCVILHSNLCGHSDTAR